MSLSLLALHRLGSLATAAVAALAVGPSWVRPAGYAPTEPTAAFDTVRHRGVDRAEPVTESSATRRAVISGYLSPRGLPPIPGQAIVGDRELVLESAQGLLTQASTISLAYMDDHDGHPVYVFRVDGGVFETTAPGPLLQLATHRTRLGHVRAVESSAEPSLVNPGDSVALWKTAREITTGSYADSLYSLFGRPRASVGLIGPNGRLAGRLGEYIAAQDSLALDPGRMMGEAQLRHALAHELGHRWQARARTQIEMLWAGVRPIRDPKRYGYGDRAEHQAEAIAFAVNFLQTTAGARETRTTSLTLLDHYELLVPGTRIMVRYFALLPIYRNHPLRLVLTTGKADPVSAL